MHDRYGFKGGSGTVDAGFIQGEKKQSVQVDGVMDLVRDFDVFLFSIHATLIRNGLTVPSGATLVPKLRKLDKRIGVFCLNHNACREDITAQLNRSGYSITNNRVLLRDDLNDLNHPFPFVAHNRVLMVCSDVLNEVVPAKSKGLATLLIDNQTCQGMASFAISPDFCAGSV